VKKQLMTTTALVVAGLLATSGAAFAQKKASKPTLKIGGWFEGIIGAVDDDDTGTNGRHVVVDVMHDSETHFKGSATLDNGIKIRTRWEFESQVSATGIDESYINISGGFGQIRIGGEDGAAHLMTTGTLGHWATNVGQNTAFDIGDWIQQPDGHAASTVNRVDSGGSDDNKITYFTPRFEGLQLGVSYMPSFQQGNHSAPESLASNETEGFQVGVSYKRKISNVGISLAAGYSGINEAASSTGDGGVDQSNPGGLGAGIVLDYGGFRAAFGYTHDWNLSSKEATQRSGDESFDFGLRYKTGKNNFSVGYMHVTDEADRITAATDSTDAAMVSYRRNIGPGVQYRLNFMWADFEGENAGSADDNNGIAVTTSIRVSF